MRRIFSENTRRRIAVLLLTVLFCMAWNFPVMAAGSYSRVVRVPYGYTDFLVVDANGNASGSYAEYFDLLAEINNWKYEYIEATWTEAVEMLEEGRIDFLYPVSRTAEREETMDFTTEPMAYTAVGLFALVSWGYAYNDISSLDGKRIAVTKNSFIEADLKEHAAKNGFSYTPVYFDTKEQVFEALKDGTVDIAATVAANEFTEAEIVSVTDAKPAYLAVRKGDTELLEELNFGMQTILKENMGVMADVLTDSMLGNNVLSIAMTDEEKAFIESGAPIVVGFYENTAPLAYAKKGGEYTGIYIEVLDYIKELTGLNLTCYPISRDKNWKTLLANGEIDFYIGSSDIIVSHDDDIRTTESFMEYSNILVTKKNVAFNRMENLRIALTYSRANWAEYLKGYFDKSFEIIYYSSSKECMDAVVNGYADASLIDNLEFHYQVKNERFSSLVQWSQYRFATRVNCAARDSVDEVKFTAFNKGIKRIGEEFINDLIEKYSSMPYDSYSAVDVLYNARYPLVVAGILIIMFVSIFVTIMRFRRKQRKVFEETVEKEKHQFQILAATSYEYASVYYIDLDTNTSEQVNRKSSDEDKKDDEKSIKVYSEAIQTVADKLAMPEYRDRILEYKDTAKVLSRFEKQSQFNVRFRLRSDNDNRNYYEMRFVKVDDNLQGHRMMILGVRCIDDIVEEERAQQQLLQDALDGANRANAAKSEFFSKMSHDIRTPLNAIIGMTAIAETHLDDPSRVRDALGKITGSGKHLLGLINDVLDMSKIETGKISLVEEAFNLSDLIGNLLTIIQPQVNEHHHNLKVNIKDIKHEDVIGDSLRMQQVLLNFMSNAVKYTPNGGNISLGVREIPVNVNNAGCYEFTFEDNGIGMSKDFIEHIFEPFSREEDLRTSKIQGTGLGMSIAHNIVQMMNGNIKVTSEPGKGSTFVVTMFLKFQEVEEADVSAFANLPILVVDDDADACESLCDILKEIGMAVEGYTSGGEAVKAVERAVAENKPYYAAILDWKMPEMDGMETAKEIRKLEGADVPIVILSAYDWSNIEEEAQETGIKMFLEKPVFKSSILRLFNQITNRDGGVETVDDSFRLDNLKKSNFEGKRILLVEDNILNREIATEILELANLDVTEAENGEEAVKTFSESGPGYFDLILMDVQMPILDGYGATRAIRALKREDAGTVPIIAMTANAFVEDVQNAKAAGMDEHLSKPIDFDKLNRILNKYLV